MRSPCSGSRTRAVTWCPARTTESSTADPMYPVAPVRKIRIAEPWILPLDVPGPLTVEERDDPVLAHLEDRAEPAPRKLGWRSGVFDNRSAVREIVGGKMT